MPIKEEKERGREREPDTEESKEVDAINNKGRDIET